MRTICVQFQPGRAPATSRQVVTALMARVAAAHEGVREFAVTRPRSGNAWVNFLFTGARAGLVWKEIDRHALHHRRLGAGLRRATIVTCQGSRGWDNYLLLHHFDEGQSLDPAHVLPLGQPPASRPRRPV